jgi:hypothetical protein
MSRFGHVQYAPPGAVAETTTAEEEVMYVIREILNCKPGKVRDMLEKFKTMSTALKQMGHEQPRILTDVTGEPFWTLEVEIKVERIDDFFAMEKQLTADASIAKTMANYHDLVNAGRREIYRIEQ